MVTLNPGVDTVELGTEHIDASVTVEDLTHTILFTIGTVDINTAGTYILTYRVVDDYDNETTILRYVTVYEKTPSIVFELEDANTTINVGDTYEDSGCFIYVDGVEHLCNIKDNNLDTSIAGIYQITYSYTYQEMEYTYQRYIFVVEAFETLELYIPMKKEEGDCV